MTPKPQTEAFFMKFFHSFWKLSRKIYLKCLLTFKQTVLSRRQQLHFYSANNLRYWASVHWRHCYLSMLMLWGSTTLHTSSTALKWYLGWRLIGQKSSLSGIGILAAEGADFANTIGCSWYKDWPIIYLGLPGAIPFQRDSGSLC